MATKPHHLAVLAGPRTDAVLAALGSYLHGRRRRGGDAVPVGAVLAAVLVDLERHVERADEGLADLEKRRRAPVLNRVGADTRWADAAGAADSQERCTHRRGCEGTLEAHVEALQTGGVEGPVEEVQP